MAAANPPVQMNSNRRNPEQIRNMRREYIPDALIQPGGQFFSNASYALRRTANLLPLRRERLLTG